MSHLAGSTSSPMTPPRTTPTTPNTPSPAKDPTISQRGRQVSPGRRGGGSPVYRNNESDHDGDLISIIEEPEHNLERRMERLDVAELDHRSADLEGPGRMSKDAPEFVPLRSRSVDRFTILQRDECGVDQITEVNESEDASESVAEHVYDTTGSETDEKPQGELEDHLDHDAGTIENSGATPTPARPVRGEPLACLFVASLSSSRTDIQLFDSVTSHFSQWGKLMHVKVLKDWMNRPYSFVQFERIEDAQRAMVEAQNTIIDGRPIRIEQARVNRTLFLLRFSRSTTEQDIRKILEEYGSLEDVSILHDAGPSGSRRYALARFAYRDDAIKAFVSLRATSHWAVEWAPNTNTSKLLDRDAIFVGQLNPDLVTKEGLRERFEQYGTIKSITLLNRGRLGNKTPIAYAFIEFSSDYEATQAIEHENNTEFQGQTISVQYRETNEYRLQRQSFLHQAHAAQSMSPAYYRTSHMLQPIPQPQPLRQPTMGASMDTNAIPHAPDAIEHTGPGAYQGYHEQGASTNTPASVSHPVYYGTQQSSMQSPYSAYQNYYGPPLYLIRGPKEDRGRHGPVSTGPTDCSSRPKQTQASVPPQSVAPMQPVGTYGPMNHRTSRGQVATDANPYDYTPFMPMESYYPYGAQPMMIYDYPQPMSPSAYGPYAAAGYFYSRPIPPPLLASASAAGGHEAYIGPHDSATGWSHHHGPSGSGSGDKSHRPSSQGGPIATDASKDGCVEGSKGSKPDGGSPASSSRK